MPPRRYNRRRRETRLRTIALALVVLLVAGVAAAVVLAATTDGDATSAPRLTADELLAYQAAVHPALRDGGQTVEQGMKPAVADLRDPGGVPPEAIADEADAWTRDLAAVRAKVAAVPVPAGLREVAAGFDAALARYLAAAAAFGRAARAPERERAALIEEGVAIAREADRHYDDASRVLQRLRRDLGLGATADFPDPVTSPSG